MVTNASRWLIARDRLLGHPPKRTASLDQQQGIVRHLIQSGDNLLDAQLVHSFGAPPRATLLICHGIGETVEHWLAAQQLLAEHHVTSLAFNYSGLGRSSGQINPPQCELDAATAFQFLQQQVPSQPISILGYSLGSGIATAISPRVKPRQLILCAAYTSLQNAAQGIGVPRTLTRMLPDVWVNEAALRSSTVPVLIVHGQEDRLFPPQMADALAAACSSSCERVIVPGLSHDDPIRHPQLQYWALILSHLLPP